MDRVDEYSFEGKLWTWPPLTYQGYLKQNLWIGFFFLSFSFFLFFSFDSLKVADAEFNLIGVVEWEPTWRNRWRVFYFSSSSSSFLFYNRLLQPLFRLVEPVIEMAMEWGTSEWRVSSFSLWNSKSLSSSVVFPDESPRECRSVRGLLIGSREPTCKLCSIETQLLSAIPYILFLSIINYSSTMTICYFFKSLGFLVQLTRWWQQGPTWDGIEIFAYRRLSSIYYRSSRKVKTLSIVSIVGMPTRFDCRALESIVIFEWKGERWQKVNLAIGAARARPWQQSCWLDGLVTLCSLALLQVTLSVQ